MEQTRKESLVDRGMSKAVPQCILNGTAQAARCVTGVGARDGTGRDGTGRDGTGRHGTARHGTARHGTARHGTVRYGMGRHGTGRDGTRRDGTGPGVAMCNVAKQNVIWGFLLCL